jgi:hypothetical protein
LSNISELRNDKDTGYVLVLAKLTFFAVGNPEFLEHRREFLVLVAVFRGWTGFNSFTVGVVVLRDEGRVVAS